MLDPGPTPTAMPEYEEAPEQRLSPVRALIALLVLAAAVYGGFVGLSSQLHASAAPRAETWFAPYVDATLPPSYPFQIPASNPAAQTVLGFIVSDPGSACTPSWGGYYTMSQADQPLVLGPRIAELAQEGAQAIVSFGGLDNTELAVACRDTGKLAAAYQAVIDRYKAHAIDLDIEGTALDDPAASHRRAEAVRKVEEEATARHWPLAVWLTVPGEPDGLQADAVSLIESMLAARVDLAGVNVMAMDFANAPSSGDMLGQVQSATVATHDQLIEVFKRYGVDLTSAQAWERTGVTVMIGQNDQAGERFTVGDARGLVAFAKRSGLGRLSMWSLNRDSQCGSTFPEVGVESPTCSGVPQSRLQFAQTFSQLNGTLSTSATSTLPPVPDTNPADAPFPLWSPLSSYESGYKVVRAGYIYQSKWYNSGEDPAAQVASSWETPWELLGPVLPGDHVQEPTTLPYGTYPQWSEAANYIAGSRVLYQGLGYQAKWANQGASPAGAVDDPGGSPWSPLYTVPGEPPPS